MTQIHALFLFACGVGLNEYNLRGGVTPRYNCRKFHDKKWTLNDHKVKCCTHNYFILHERLPNSFHQGHMEVRPSFNYSVHDWLLVESTCRQCVSFWNKILNKYHKLSLCAVFCWEHGAKKSIPGKLASLLISTARNLSLSRPPRELHYLIPKIMTGNGPTKALLTQTDTMQR